MQTPCMLTTLTIDLRKHRKLVFVLYIWTRPSFGLSSVPNLLYIVHAVTAQVNMPGLPSLAIGLLASTSTVIAQSALPIVDLGYVRR